MQVYIPHKQQPKQNHMEAEQACLSDVAPWWSHRCILDEAEPLDATADDAAASCLAEIAKQTAMHTLAYRNELLSLIAAEHPAKQSSVAHTHQHTGETNRDGLYQRMKWDGVLVPLLTQLRKCMARAWDERAAEKAEQAADDTTAPAAAAAAFGLSGAKAMQSPHVDAVQARRLRVLQQQIYLAFFKAILQGLADGARDLVAVSANANTATPENVDDTADSHDSMTTEAENTALASRVLSALLDNLLTHILSWATAAATTVSPHIDDGDGAKSRRGLSRRVSSAAGFHTGDWFTGMLPLYLRAAHQQQLRRHGIVVEQDGTASGSAPALLIPSPTLCLVSYIGAFVQDAGLQLLPSEQETYLPCFTHAVHSEFRDQLQKLVQAAIAHSEYATAIVAESDATAVVTVAAHIRYAADVLKSLIDTQLYCNTNTTEDDDCTMVYAALPRPPAPRQNSQQSEMPTGGDYSLAPLLVLTSYKVCEGLLGPMSSWWITCKHMARKAGMCGTAMVARGDSEGTSGKEQQRHSDYQAAGIDMNRLAVVDEAWQGLRKQVVNLTLVLSNYDETTLLLVPYMALITDLFFSSASDGQKQEPPSAEAWRCCVREMHRVTHATHDGSHALSMHAASGARRQLRMHHRQVRDYSFSAACFSRVIDSLNHTPTNVHSSTDAASDGVDHKLCTTEPHKLLPLAFAALQQPLSVIQEHIFRHVLSVNRVTLDLSADAVVRNKGVSKEQEVAASAATSTPCSKALTEELMSAVQLVELHFPHFYRVFSALDEAMQYVLDSSQHLTSDNTVAEEAEDGGKVTLLWTAPSSLSATLANFIGAALDEACVARMQNTSDEVAVSELLMFFEAVFCTLPPTALPRLRAALETFLGKGGCDMIEYLRSHIVDHQRHGLAAFFLPPLRAMALDYTTAEDADVSLALTAKYPCSGSMAYLWERPRLYFWSVKDTPVAEVAWHAQVAAQRYLCELVTSTATTAIRRRSPFLDIVQSSAEVAMGRWSNFSDKTKITSGLFWTRSLAMDMMRSLFFGVCRWCALQLSTSASSSVAPLSAEAATTLILYLCTPSLTSLTPSSTNAAAYSFLVSLRNRTEAQPASNQIDAPGVQGNICSSSPKENAEAANSLSPSSLAATQQWFHSNRNSRWHSWFWAAGYDQVGNVERLHTAAKRLLREFSAHCGPHTPTKTLLSIRAGVEQIKLKGTQDVDAALHELRDAVRGDTEALLKQQEQKQLRDKPEDEKLAAVDSIDNPQEAAMTATTNTSIAAAETALRPATLREYLDHIHEALVQRARISPIDGAISAATLGHLLHVLSDSQLPIVMTAQERQRMCQRFFFTLANSLTDCTRTEALSCLCCMRCVLQDIVLPYKKSFLTEDSTVRVFHCSLPDTEADAFRMVQHTFGDVVMAVQKIAQRNSILDEWKIVMVLQHLGDTISLVRSVVEKIQSTVKKIVSRRKSVAIDAMVQRLAVVEKSALCTELGVADDVCRLYTLHPISPPAPQTITSAKAAATTAPTTSSFTVAAAAPEERSRGSQRNYSHRERERRNERDRKKKLDGGAGRGRDHGSGTAGDNSRKRSARNDSKQHRPHTKRPRH